VARRLSRHDLIQINRQLAEIGERICPSCGWRGEINRENFKYRDATHPGPCRPCYRARQRRRMARKRQDAAFRAHETQYFREWRARKPEQSRETEARKNERKRARRLRRVLQQKLAA
jgi:hypothetical protein